MGRKKKPAAQRTKSFERPTVPDAELAQLPALIKKQCGWDVKDFQLEALIALAAGKDVIAHAPTGSGKTVMFSPLFGPPPPAIAQRHSHHLRFATQVKMLRDELNIKAVAVNSSRAENLEEAFKVLFYQYTCIQVLI